MTRIPLFLLLLVLPLGVAGQNIGGALCGAWLLAQYLYRCYRKKTAAAPVLPQLPSLRRRASFLTAAFLVIQIVATFANPTNPSRFSIQYVWGHLMWAFLAPIALLAQYPLRDVDWRRLEAALAVVATFMATVALSQALCGWHIVGVRLEYGAEFARAQGLYSHPMSFAYACLVLFPYGLMAVLRAPKRVLPWITFLAATTCLLASRSRMVEVVALGTTLVIVAASVRGKRRSQILLALAALTLAILLTPNPIGERFRGMLTRHDVHSDYQDDRLAFWRANALMVSERPLLGHGEGLGTVYRKPYYAAIGLADFDRQYEAHNMYLQLLVNVGGLGFLIFMLWLYTICTDLWRARQNLPDSSAFAARVGLVTLAAFGAAAVTQNAFQDSAVRYVLSLALAAVWLATATDASTPRDRVV